MERMPTGRSSIGRVVGNSGSFDSFDPFNFFNFDIFDFWRSSPENSATYGSASLVWALPLLRVRAKAMLKISILDTQSHRRLVVEGKLIAPWAAELTSVWRKATADPEWS